MLKVMGSKYIRSGATLVTILAFLGGLSLIASPAVYAGTDDTFTGDCTAGLAPGQCGIVDYIQLAINVLSAMTGVVIVIMLVVGGIQYSMSADNANETEAAKTRIRNALVALVAFLFTFAFLQYVVPGGAF
jgi:hypothetical protein